MLKETNSLFADFFFAKYLQIFMISPEAMRMKINKMSIVQNCMSYV